MFSLGNLVGWISMQKWLEISKNCWALAETHALDPVQSVVVHVLNRVGMKLQVGLLVTVAVWKSQTIDR